MGGATAASKRPAAQSHKSPAATFLAGAVAGAVAKTTIAPLDRTKINFQVSSRRYSFRQAIKFVVNAYRHEGLRSLWRGNSATMARVMPYAAIQFTAHEQYKLMLRPSGSDHGVLPPFRRLVAGSLAGCTATVITYPLDLARARMAVTDMHVYRGFYDVLWSTVKSEGLRGLYRGVSPTILGIIPYAGLSFFTYESLKKLYIDRYSTDPPSLPRLWFGAVAGLVGQNASYPLDIVRRRMQTEGLVTQVSYRDIAFTLMYVLRSEGWRGVYKGVSMNWIKGPIAVSVSFNTYEVVLRYIQRLDVFN